MNAKQEVITRHIVLSYIDLSCRRILHQSFK